MVFNKKTVAINKKTAINADINKLLEEYGLLIRGVSERIKNEAK